MVAAALLAAWPVRAGEVDVAHSQVGFQLVTRWGEVVEGHFPVFDGDVTQLADGRKQVRLSLSTPDVEILGSPRRTALTRGSGFFDAKHYPRITFLSDPFDPALLQSGGPLPGMLGIRDVQRREAFAVAASTCDRPGVECPVLAAGVVDRSAYGMNRWSVALGRKVRFQLRIRVEEGTE